MRSKGICEKNQGKDPFLETSARVRKFSELVKDLQKAEKELGINNVSYMNNSAFFPRTGKSFTGPFESFRRFMGWLNPLRKKMIPGYTVKVPENTERGEKIIAGNKGLSD